MLKRFFFMAFLICTFASSAHAQMTVCNKTAAPLSLAVAYEADDNVVSQGWWDIKANDCMVVIEAALSHPYYYYYAASKALNVEWTGNFNFCSSNESQFRIEGATGCEARNFTTKGFRQINVGTRKKGTLDITMAAPPAH